VGGVENKRFIVDGLQRNCMPEDVRFVVVVIWVCRFFGVTFHH